MQLYGSIPVVKVQENMPISRTIANPDRLIVGCGYLGQRVAQRWQPPGRTIALTRGRTDELTALGVAPIVGDVLDPASLKYLPEVGVVVYAVGFDRNAGHSMRQVYVEGLANVLDALPGEPKFVYVSSTSVYGQTNGEWVDENSATEPAEESGKIVREAERILRAKRPSAIILRFAGIYGPGRLLRRVDSLRKGEPIAANPNHFLNLIHIDDGVSAVLAAIEAGSAGEIYNVSDGQPPTRQEFYVELARLLKAPPPRFAPGSTGTNRRIANDKLKGELGVPLQFPSFREGLPASIEAVQGTSYPK